MPLARAEEDLLFEIGLRVSVVALLVLLAGLVLEWSPLVPASLVLLGGLYGVQLTVDDASLDSAAALVAAGALVTAELAFWSLEERERVNAEPGEGLRRLALTALLALGALVVAGMLLALVDRIGATGIAVDLAGAAAAAGALLAIVVAARSRDARP